MPIVNVNEYRLKKSHKALEKSFRGKDWESVCENDRQLADTIDILLSDKKRDTRALVNELENILSTYSKIIAEIPGQHLQKSSPTDK